MAAAHHCGFQEAKPLDFCFGRVAPAPSQGQLPFDGWCCGFPPRQIKKVVPKRSHLKDVYVDCHAQKLGVAVLLRISVLCFQTRPGSKYKPCCCRFTPPVMYHHSMVNRSPGGDMRVYVHQNKIGFKIHAKFPQENWMFRVFNIFGVYKDLYI